MKMLDLSNALSRVESSHRRSARQPETFSAVESTTTKPAVSPSCKAVTLAGVRIVQSKEPQLTEMPLVHTSISQLYSMMDEMESPNSFQPSHSAGAGGVTGVTDETSMETGNPSDRIKSFEACTFAMMTDELEEGYGGDALRSMSSEALSRRKREKDEERARRKQGRLARQAEADNAKIAFGLSYTEKKERAKRAERMEQNTFDVQRERAVRGLGGRSRRVLITNLVAVLTQVAPPHITGLTPIPLTDFSHAASQVLQVLDLYQAVDPPPESIRDQLIALSNDPISFGLSKNGGFNAPLTLTRPPRDEFPINSFVYTACGIFGSCLTVCAVLIVQTVVWSQGIKSTTIPTLCKFAVHLMYFSGALQGISFFNLCFSLQVRGHERSTVLLASSPTCAFRRVAPSVSRSSSFYSARLLFRQPIRHECDRSRLHRYPRVGVDPVPAIHTHVQHRYESRHRLQRPHAHVPAFIPSWHHLHCPIHPDALDWIGSLVCIHPYDDGVAHLHRNGGGVLRPDGGWSCHDVSVVLGPRTRWPRHSPLLLLQVRHPSQHAQPLATRTMHRSSLYRYVTSIYASLEDAAHELEGRKEDIASAARATIIVGNSVRVQYLVDKPFLNGRRGVILDTPDHAGRVGLMVDGKYDLRLDEFQLGPDVLPAELQSKQEFVVLKTAEMLHAYDKQTSFVNLMERLYVIFGQIVLGLAVTFFILLIHNATFTGNVMFQMLIDAINNVSANNHVSANTTGFNIRLQRQGALCADWTQCIAGRTRPGFCGNCVVPPPYGFETVPSTVWNSMFSFTQGSPFTGDSLPVILMYASIVGVSGTILTMFITLRVGKARLKYAICVGFVALVVWGTAGMAISALPPAIIQHINLIDPEQCNQQNIDGNTEGTPLPDNCVPIVGAYYFSRMTLNGARVAIACPYASFLQYLFEGLSFLSRNIKARNTFAWARFELGVSFFYTMIQSLFVLLWIYLLRHSDTGQALRPVAFMAQVYNRVRLRAAEDLELYGADFPLAFNQTVSLRTEGALNLWYKDCSPRTLCPITCTLSLRQVHRSQHNGNDNWPDHHPLPYRHGLRDGRHRRDDCYTRSSSRRRPKDPHTFEHLALHHISRFVPGETQLLTASPHRLLDLTHLASKVSLINNFFLFFTIPTLIQFVFGVQFAGHTDILPMLKNLEAANPVVLAGRVLALVLPFALLTTLSLLAAILWTHDPTDAAEYAALNSSAAAFTVLGAIALVVAFVGSCYVGRLFAFQIINMGQFLSSERK